MTGTLGLLETTGLTPAMVAIDAMLKTATVRVFQLELNDLLGVCVKITGSTADVQTAVEVGRNIAERMNGEPVVAVLTNVSSAAFPAIHSQPEFNPLIQQSVVFEPEAAMTGSFAQDQPSPIAMNQETPQALGFIETQGFTAVFEAIDTACKAANVEVVGKEKLGGGFVTVVIQGQLAAVEAAIQSGKESVDGLGKLIAAHVIARPSEPVLKLLPKL
ncbi:MAG TPA: BMC domain-containing protein [Patescibacteria group bacterium]|jgi:microcompartment protein CcmL/EutN|nr:BMC domain-containing protein [Patescibacteria group bacterium]